MNATLTTPAGNKVRTATMRRYVLVADVTDVSGESEAIITRRSNSIPTLRAVQRRLGNEFARNGSSVVRYVMDTVTRELVP